MLTHDQLEKEIQRDPGGFRLDAWVKNAAAEFASQIVRGAPQMRMDTTTGLFENQLEYVMAQSYDRRYPGLKWREFVPAAAGIPAGAETVTQRGYDIEGHSTILAGDAFDVRRVTLDAMQQSTRIVSLAVKWVITMQQLRAAALAGVPLDTKGAQAATRIIERDIDSLVSLGDASLGLQGFCTQPVKAWGAAGAGVVTAVAGAPVGFTATWNTVATAAQILFDVALMRAWFSAQNVWEPTHLLLGSTTYAVLENMVALAGSPQTVLEVIRSRYQGMTVATWSRLDTASGTGGERAVMYARDPAVVEAIVPVESEVLQPLWTGLGYETVTHSRCGGIQAADTTGILYADM